MTRLRRVLVLGGTGFVGRSVCERLVEHGGGAGVRITVPTRRIAHARTVQFLPTVDPLECDVHDDTQLSRLVVGHDAVVNLIAILHGSPADFERVHAELPRRLARACAAARVTRIVHVSALGVGATAPSDYLRSKAAGEAALEAAGLNLTILRPSVIFGHDDRFLNLFAALQALVPVLPLAGLSTQFQPVWVEDVAEAVVRCLADPATAGQTFECAGPRVYTLGELVKLVGQLTGHERKLIALPESIGELQARLMELLPGEPLMSRDNIRSMQVPNIATHQLPGLQALGIQPAALESIAAQYLAPGAGLARLNRWRALRRHA